MAEDKLAILGGKGMLGTDLARQCTKQDIAFEVFDLPDFDITNDQQLSNVVTNNSIVINCAAYTNVDKAESEAELAYKVNADAVGRLGTLARQADIWLLHISTDFVFDGKSDRPYVETDTPNPINSYGAGKLAGEQLLVESRCRHCIMRVEWTYGRAGNNFVTKLIQHAKTNKTLKVVDDQIGSPTATTEVAKVICKLVKNKPEGLFHFASQGYVSRFDMAKFIFDNLKWKVDLSPCKTSDFPTPAQRPLNSCFDCSKIKVLLDEPINTWQGPLENFLRKL
ncbi:MAG: dTDP-4-dehydrorhamnose reductase [Planctomycetota bacterium]|nr:MAG: dTDP-4-dehydrorhamnose reductase [Planctomycetota bacterium]